MKNIFFLVIFVLICYSCNSKPQEIIKLFGFAQGTTYSISYYEDNNINYQKQIDSLLKEFDKSVSIYIPNSLISRINRNEQDVVIDNIFREIFIRSREVSEKTDGAFDITVAPLVNNWGFGHTDKTGVDSAGIDSLKEFVDYKLVTIESGRIVKQDPRVMLDFNAIAQGGSVELIAGYLEGKGIDNYLVEIGGEVKAKGRKVNGDAWRIGIDKPIDDPDAKNRELQEIVRLTDKSLATSGNYRKYYIENGVKYSHTIDPETGFPVRHSLLSVTVVCDNCMLADAWATAFMVMGSEKSITMAEDIEGIEAYFIYSGKNGEPEIYCTEGFKDMIEE